MRALPLLTLTSFLALAAFCPNASAATVGLTSVSALGTADTFLWSQFGPDSTTVATPANITSVGGATGNVTSSGGYVRVLVQGEGWNGNFSPGTSVLYSLGLGPDITINLTNPVSAIGAQIEANQQFPFTAQVEAFNSSDDLLGTFTENGISTSAGDGSAIFIGIEDSTADIASLQFSLSAGVQPNQFAIGPVDIGAGAAAPLPGSLMLFASGLAALSLYSFWRRKA